MYLKNISIFKLLYRATNYILLLYFILTLYYNKISSKFLDYYLKI